ncbi:MAG: N-formylglutamate amidohydrolase [Burkholderiaceae bacterium]|jgi:N-formylglutamate deformylase
MRSHTQPLSYHLNVPADYPQSGVAAPVVLDSPHSGTDYPPDFGATVPHGQLRTAEDTWVADLWGSAPELGIPLLAARFPRSYIDANRSLQEIDPLLLDTPWPHVLPESAKVRLGKGLIWRMLDDGTPLYDRKLSHQEVNHRINACWRPYHDTLEALINTAHKAFGKVWHINCHSMPSVAAAFATDKPGLVHPDIVLGDLDGLTAGPEFAEMVGNWLADRGYSVAVNDPYKGVEIVRRFGGPQQGRHSLQLEINRKLYMDETTLRPHEGYARVQADLNGLMHALVAWSRDQLRDVP